MAHAAGGVEAGGELEADVGRVDVVAVEAGGADQGEQSGQAGLRDAAEAVGDERAVLADERGDVGDGPEGGQREGVD